MRRRRKGWHQLANIPHKTQDLPTTHPSALLYPCTAIIRFSGWKKCGSKTDLGSLRYPNPSMGGYDSSRVVIIDRLGVEMVPSPLFFCKLFVTFKKGCFHRSHPAAIEMVDLQRLSTLPSSAKVRKPWPCSKKIERVSARRQSPSA